LNEDAVVAWLAAMNFVAVPLEKLQLAEQIARFADADIIVAPHGAGLTNIVYARPGCRLAAVFGVAYRLHHRRCSARASHRMGSWSKPGRSLSPMCSLRSNGPALDAPRLMHYGGEPTARPWPMP
jgi:hypothetical protein